MDLPVIGNAQAASGCASGGCGSAPDALARLPDHIRAKVQDHPCYPEEARHYFARMHVAMAPACNIQCNYCNRKYDGANESRPGVVSELLQSEQVTREPRPGRSWPSPRKPAPNRRCKFDNPARRMR